MISNLDIIKRCLAINMYGRGYENNKDNRDCDRDSRDSHGYMNHECHNEEHQCRHNHEFGHHHECGRW